MTTKEIATFAISLIILSTFSAGLSLDSDSVSDYVEDETDNLEETVQDTTAKTKDEVLDEKTLSGILIPTTDSMSTKLETVRNNIPTNVPANSYFLLSNENTYLVFASDSTSVGEYEVRGNQFPSFTVEGENYATIVAKDVNEEIPDKVSLEDLEDNVEDYRYKEVKVSGTLRETSVSTDYQTHLSSPLSFGFLTTVEPLDENIVGNLRERTEKLAKNPNWNTFEDVFGLSDSRIPVLDLNQRYWTNSEAEVTGVVLSPEDFLQIKQVASPQTKELIEKIENEGAIYVKDVEYKPRKADISEIHSMEPGENVQFTGYGSINSISVQETLASSGVTVPVDTILKAGTIWSQDNPEENVIVVGASSRKGQISSISGGKYKIKGKTISAQTLDSSFPSSRKIVVLHSLDRQLEIDNIMDRNPEIEDKEKLLDSILEGEELEYRAEKNKVSQNPEEQSQEIQREETSDNSNIDSIEDPSISVESGSENSSTDQSSDTKSSKRQKNSGQEEKKSNSKSQEDENGFSDLVSRIGGLFGL